jgi:competence protein ComEC
MNKGLYYIEQLPYASFPSYHGVVYYLTITVIMLGLCFALQYRNKRVLKMSLVLLLLLVSIQSFYSVSTRDKKTITFYTLRKNLAFGFFSGGKAWVCSDLDSADKTLGYSIKAAVESSASDVRFFKLKHIIENNTLYSDKNFFMFNGWRMLIWDKEFNHNLPEKRIKVDVLLISGRPKIVLKDILKVVKFDELLIDATNSDYHIKKWTDEASALSLNYRVLKKRPAYTINLN